MFCEFAIIGTTASGKSDLAIKIAKICGGVILSLDSLCVYKKIDIASAKPNKDELATIRHFGVNLVEPDEYFSVGEFIKEYEKALNFAISEKIPLIITGGSGFYLKAMMSGLAPKIPDFTGEIDMDEIWNLITLHDPKYAEKFSQNDKFRLKKWYSIYHATGEIPSRYLQENTAPAIIKNLKIFEISTSKEILNNRIAKRTHLMLENGLLNEAKTLFELYPKDTKSLSCIGLKECGEFLQGSIDENQLYSLICTHTSQLAKRQRTFNKSQFIDKISKPLDDLESEILKFLKST